MLNKYLDKIEFENYNDFLENFKINVPENFNFGYDYIKGLCMLFGIPKTHFVSAEALDVWGNDVDSIMASAKEKITEMVKEL